MSTEHINDLLDRAVALAGQAFIANEEEHQRLLEEQAKATRDAEAARKVLEAATRAAEQRRDDVLERVGHDLAQTARIRGDVPPAPAADTNTPAPADAPPANTPPAPTQTLPPPPPQATTTTTVTRRQRIKEHGRRIREHEMNPEHWSNFQWFLAVVGAIIAFFVARNYFPDMISNMTGFGKLVACVCYWIIVIGLGSFVGGLIGSLFNKEQTNTTDTDTDIETESTTVTQTVPPAAQG